MAHTRCSGSGGRITIFRSGETALRSFGFASGLLFEGGTSDGETHSVSREGERIADRIRLAGCGEHHEMSAKLERQKRRHEGKQRES